MYVYWIKKIDHIDVWSEGYVGVSINIQKRFQQHRRSKEVVGKAIRKYFTEMKILYEGTKTECVAMEILLRPRQKIGWNLATGGGVPPSQKFAIRGEETRRKNAIAAAKTKNAIGHKIKHTEEYKAKMRQIGLARRHSKQVIEKIRLATIGNINVRGTQWYNNGIIQVRRKEAPEGFNVGMLKGKK